jgi:hypothetical protein
MNTAWMAGLFEGEGSISISHKKHYCYLQLASTDKDVLDRFAEQAGCGAISYCGQRPHQTKEVWKWQVGNKKDVSDLLNRMLPFLGERRSLRALNVFDYYDGCYSCTAPEAV